MRTQLRWYHRARPLLGTRIELAIRSSREAAERAATAAFGRIAQFHALMSFHEPGSDMRRIAALAAGQSVRVAPETFAVLSAALAFERESDGVFDVAIGDELVARGCLPDPRPPLEAWAERRTSASASANLRLDLDDGAMPRVTVLQPVWLDLGGIAKGAAVDAALEAIRSTGVEAALVNAGGDLAAFGTEQAIGVRGPGGILVAAGQLTDGAVATSGPFGGEVVATDDRVRSSGLVLRRGARCHWPDRTITVVAPCCLIADALTKIVAAMGPAASPLLARHGAEAFTVDALGRIEPVV